MRVVWATGETMDTLLPTNRFTSVDFPTLGRPDSATNPERKPACPAAVASGGVVSEFLVMVSGGKRGSGGSGDGHSSRAIRCAIPGFPGPGPSCPGPTEGGSYRRNQSRDRDPKGAADHGEAETEAP